MAHHPRRERRRLASASPASCAGAGSVEVTGGTSRHPSTPKRLARVARLLPRPSRRSWRPETPPRRTSPRSLKYWGRFRSTFPKPRRQAATPVRGAATPRIRGRLSAAAGCREHTVRWSPAATTTQWTRLSESWQRHNEDRASARVEAVVPRPARAGLDVRDCDSAPSLLGGRLPASTITSCVGT